MVEEVCRSPRWVHYFQHHHKLYYHPTPEEYRTLAEQNKLEVAHLHVEDKSWNFQTRQGFSEYCQVMLAEWARFLPEQECSAFIRPVAK